MITYRRGSAFGCIGRLLAMVVSRLVTMLTSYKDRNVLPYPNNSTFSAVFRSYFHSMSLGNYAIVFVADI